MIALAAFRHLTAELSRDLELGPMDHQRKLGEAVEPTEYPTFRRRLRERARDLAGRPRAGGGGAESTLVTSVPPHPSTL